MRDVAARVGVSQALVSLVFRNAPGASAETRDRVFRAAAELGYRPDTAAQLLRRTRSGNIGVLFAMQDTFSVDIVESIYPAAQRLGYQVILGAALPTRDEQGAVDELLDYRAEALIVIDPKSDNEQLAALAKRLPIVDVGRRVRADGVDVVRVADDRGARVAVEHLIGLGHHAIVHIDGGKRPGSPDRRRGYRSAMRKHGLAEQIRVLPGDNTEESGARAAREFLREDRLPTAIFAGNDRCAHGVLDTLIRARIEVPGDVSVVGFDDSRMAGLSFIDLTSVRQDAARIADQAVQAIAERLDDGRIEARDIVLDPTLVVRGSTGPPRRRG